MMMTTSSNDAEALAAVRRANAMLAAEGATWNVLLRNPSQSPTMKPYNPPKPSGRGVFDVDISPKTWSYKGELK